MADGIYRVVIAQFYSMAWMIHKFFIIHQSINFSKNIIYSKWILSNLLKPSDTAQFLSQSSSILLELHPYAYYYLLIKIIQNYNIHKFINNCAIIAALNVKTWGRFRNIKELFKIRIHRQIKLITTYQTIKEKLVFWNWVWYLALLAIYSNSDTILVSVLSSK